MRPAEALGLFDAHNHLQDERLAPFLLQVLPALEQEGVRAAVVNGSSEEDWPAVLELSRRWPGVVPSFGYHPWYVKERSGQWQQVLLDYLGRVPSAVGEIGLDRWVKGHDLPEQEKVFIWQLRLAAERNLPVSIHCLQAWGRLLELLRAEPRPACGFVLHSFGGPVEMVEPLAELGAYFSLPGYYAHQRKEKQRDAFRHVPLERLLIETDAPDQLLPPERERYTLLEAGTGNRLNHPANLKEVYRFAAELRGMSLPELSVRVEHNFRTLFGPLLRM